MNMAEVGANSGSLGRGWVNSRAKPLPAPKPNQTEQRSNA